MKNSLWVFLFCLIAGSAEARVHHGGVGTGAASSAPVLQSVSVPFGALTPSLRGMVRLSSVDTTTTANQPVTFSGLNLWVGGNPCAVWNQTFVSGRSSGDYYLIGTDTPEGATAQTPTPTPTGATSATGTYVFGVSCKDAGGHVSNTVNITYVTVANAVNIGTYDRTDSGVTPAGFGSVAGAQILLSVGADYHTQTANECCTSMRWDSGTYTNQVTVTNADNARKPYTQVFTFSDNSGGMCNYHVTNITLSGQLSTNQLIAGFLSNLAGCDNVVWDNIHGYFSNAYALGTFGAGQTGNAWDALGCKAGAVACGISNSDFDYVGSGYAPESNSYVKNVWIRHYYNNCVFFGNSSNTDIEDGGCIAPMISPVTGFSINNVHLDSCQMADGATPDHVTIKRFLAAQGDGNTQVQTCIFAGSLFNTNCYVDDGTGVHGAGVVLTCPAGFQTSSNGSLITIPSHFDYTNSVRLTLSSGTQGTLSNITPTVIGSPGSPVATYGDGIALDMNIDGLINSQSAPNGFETAGEAGTTVVQDFAYFQQNATPAGETSFLGSIDNSTAIMTVTTAPTINYPGEAPTMIDGGRVSVPGFCTYCGPNINNQISGTLNGVGTYQLSSWGLGTVSAGTSIKNSNGYALPDNTVGAVGQGSFCAVTAIHIGSYTLRNGTSQAGINLCSPGLSNTTTSNLATSMPAANYASGVTPQAYLQAQTWSSRVSSAPLLTNAQILTLNCLAVKPKIGGGLDRGAGLWLGPVTGETNAGTHTGGGNWTTNNGTDSGIAIPGCSAAP